MANISAGDVKKLRDRTNAPMMDCKAALEKAGGDIEKAAQILREQNKAIADKKGERETAEGRIAIYTDPSKPVAAILEMRCESAPVAKGEDFIKLANDIVKHIALTSKEPTSVDDLLNQSFVDDPKKTVRDRINDTVGLIRENMKPARFKRLTGGVFGGYVHFDGTVGVLLQAEGTKGDPQLLKDVCMHITAKQPAAARREDVPAETLAREKEIVANQIKADPKNANKPANIVEKIAEGKMKTWFADNVLVEQPFVKDDTKTVGDLLKANGLTVQRFIRYKVGELT